MVEKSRSSNMKLATFSSDDIVEDLLKDVQRLSTPFLVDEIASRSKKEKKKHRHKSKKRKKDKHKGHQRSRSRSRSRSKERKRRKKHREIEDESVPTSEEVADAQSVVAQPEPESSSAVILDDDELPIGADFRRVLKETKMSIKIHSNFAHPSPSLTTKSSNSTDIGVKDEMSQGKLCNGGEQPQGKTTSDILQEVILKKGKGDFMPRQLKQSSKVGNAANQAESQPSTKSSVGENECSSANSTCISAKASNNANEQSISVEKICQRSKEERKKSRSRTASPNTDEELWKKASNGRKKRKSRTRSREKTRSKRSRSPARKDRKRSRSRSRRRQRSPVRNHNRRSRSRSKTRGSPQRRYRSRSHSRSRYSRRRARSSERNGTIDKKKLLEIAKRNSQKLQPAVQGRNLPSQSVEDFVSYCERLQKRQEKENRRERGEAVSSDDDEGVVVNFKHPYPLPKTESIRINILNATTSSLAQKAIMSSEETVVDPRIVFPVSSGAVHKENLAIGWTPVRKEEVPLSCSSEQKKHVAMTSLEVEKCRQMGIPTTLHPPPAPPILGGILPPPPPPPRFLVDPKALQRPLSPPPLPPMLYVPPNDELIMKEPSEPAPTILTDVLTQRAEAQKRLFNNPNDYDARKLLKTANDQMTTWATLKSLPGKFTGSTGVNILRPDELQPHDPRFHAWVKKDMFKRAQPNVSGVGMRMMQKMGWRPGEGLGKEATGNVEPLLLDVKSDRKGLLAEEELPESKKSKMSLDLTGKHPVSVLMEFCAKRRWQAPAFSCQESGPSNCREFLWKVIVNGIEYQPINTSRVKKDGKSVACQVALQALGFFHEPNVQ